MGTTAARWTLLTSGSVLLDAQHSWRKSGRAASLHLRQRVGGACERRKALPTSIKVLTMRETRCLIRAAMEYQDTPAVNDRRLEMGMSSGVPPPHGLPWLQCALRGDAEVTMLTPIGSPLSRAREFQQRERAAERDRKAAALEVGRTILTALGEQFIRPGDFLDRIANQASVDAYTAQVVMDYLTTRGELEYVRDEGIRARVSG